MSTTTVIDALKVVLADSYALFLKTQNYHWNAEGPNFRALHNTFEEQYTELFPELDEIAELIRGLGEKAPGTWKTYAAIGNIKDGDEHADATTMLRDLANDQLVIQKTLQTALEAAQEVGDEVVVGAMVDRLTVHRKNHWLLSSALK